MKKLLFLLLAAVSAFPQSTINIARTFAGVNRQTGTTYTFVAKDSVYLTTLANDAGVSANLPSSITYGFGAGHVFSAKNAGAGIVTLTCVSCLIDGGQTLSLTTGQGVDLYSDGLGGYSTQLYGVGNGGGGGSITGINTLTGSGLQGGGSAGILSLSLLKSCASTQVLAWDGSAWDCASQTSMTYPGAGIAQSLGVNGPWGSPLQVGTSANNLLQLDSQSRIPAVNGSLLTNLAAANITGLTAASVGLSNVTNNAQAWAQYYPNVAPTSAQIPVGTGTAYAARTVGGDCVISSTGVLTCSKTNGVNFAPSATVDALNASNVNAGTLNVARLPSIPITSLATGTANVLLGNDNSGVKSEVTIGANLTLSGGVLAGTGAGTGNVTGPASSTAHDLTAYADATGVLLEDSGVLSTDVVTATGTKTLTNKTIAGTSNTITNIGNSSLTNSSVTINLPANLSGGGSLALGGTLNITNANQSANLFWAGPSSGVAATPTFRAIAVADVPTLNQNTSGTAANLSGTPLLPTGTTAATQTLSPTPDATQKLATDAFVTGMASSILPTVPNVRAIGTNPYFARADHDHGHDTAKQDLVGATGLLSGGGSGSVAQPTIYTVGTLPGNPVGNPIYLVSDSSTECSVGGGTTKTFCRWNGSGWEQYGGAAGSGFSGTYTGDTTFTGNNTQVGDSTITGALTVDSTISTAPNAGAWEIQGDSTGTVTNLSNPVTQSAIGFADNLGETGCININPYGAGWQCLAGFTSTPTDGHVVGISVSGGVISLTDGGTGGGGSSTWDAITDPINPLALSMATNTTTFTYGDQGASASTNLFNITDAATTATDLSKNVVFDTGASSKHSSFLARYRGTNVFQVCPNLGGNYAVALFGNGAACSALNSVNATPVPGVMIQQTNNNAYTGLRVLHKTAAQTGDTLALYSQTVSGTGFNILDAKVGCTDGDGTCAAGASKFTVRGDGATTIAGHLTVESVTSTGATGAGNLVFSTTPTLTTPNIGVATGTLLTLGANGGTGGSVVLRGSTSGSATINTSVTGVLALPSGTTATSMALTTPDIGAATGTSLLATGIVDGKAAVTISTGTPVTLGGTYKSGYTFNQHATAGTAVTYNLPTAAAGLQYCVANSYNGSAANTGKLTLQTSAAGQYIIFTDGTLSATGGYVDSTTGAAGDAACVVGVDATHWMLYVNRGTWTKH